MIWPAMVFNLCVGLLFAAYLLRAVRRFERRADAILAKMDQYDFQSQHKFELAREEIRASMRAKVDHAIAETVERFQAAGGKLPVPSSGGAGSAITSPTGTGVTTFVPNTLES
jgi:hypothetical protein